MGKGIGTGLFLNDVDFSKFDVFLSECKYLEKWLNFETGLMYDQLIEEAVIHIIQK
jgi:hypothetical protein